MPLSQQQWLSRAGNFMCVLVEAEYIEAGELKTLYLSNHYFRSIGTDTPSHQPYKNLLNSKSTLTFSQRMSVALYGETETGTSAIEFFLHPSLENLIINSDFSGQKITVLIGDPTWPRDNFITKFQGYSESLDPVDDNRARIVFSDQTEKLNTGILTELITSGENTDNFIPLLFGKCFNVEPVLIDELTKTYQLNNGPISEVLEVREGGFLISPSNYSVDLLSGTLTLNKNVTGRITCDAKGYVHEGNYLSTAEQIINQILVMHGESTSIDENILPTYELGLFISSQRDISDVFDEISVSVGANWFYDEIGRFRLQHYTGLNQETGYIKSGQVKSNSLRVKERFSAWNKLILGYQKNHTVQTDGLAVAITENSPELTALYGKEYSVVSESNTLLNHSSSIEQSIDTLIANKADAEVERDRLLSLHTEPYAIYELDTIIKKHNQGETINLSYSRYFQNGRSAVVVGHIHNINKPTDKVEVLA